MSANIRKIILTFLAIAALITLGTYGYIHIEDLSFLDALYMTIITLSTVGFSEVTPLSPEGKIFTIFVILCGITIFIYLLGSITSLMFEGFLINYFKGVTMKKKIEKLNKHTIIIGYGRTGENLIEIFFKNETPFVLIEKDSEKIEKFRSKYPFKDVFYILGDATDDQVLIDAGIKNAATLIPVLSNDADNLFTVMSSKFLNHELNIIARVNDNHNYAKLKKAGATSILSPHEVTAKRLFNLAIDSNIMTFTDLMDNYENSKNLTLARVKISNSSGLLNKNLIEAEIPKKTGLIVIGIAHSNKINFNPKPQDVIKEDNTLIVMGTLQQIKALQEIC